MLLSFTEDDIRTDEFFMVGLDVAEVACTFPALSDCSCHLLVSHVGIFKHDLQAFCLYLRNVQVVSLRLVKVN